MKQSNVLKLTMLGTGNALATRCYNTCFTLENEEKIFLVDAGGGNEIIRILQEEKLSLAEIHDFFITHAHSDHVLGAVWVIRMIGQMMNQKQYDGELRIYAHGQLIKDLQMICGDEPIKEELQQKADHAKYLLHEAFCLYEEREKFKPYEKHHSTVRDVCILAESLHVENLILMHTEDSHIEDRKALYLEEGSKVYHGNLMIPDDREKIWIANV